MERSINVLNIVENKHNFLFPRNTQRWRQKVSMGRVTQKLTRSNELRKFHP